MKVKELMTLLSGIDQELEVVGLSEENAATVFEIEEIAVVEGEQVRAADGTPGLKVGKSAVSKRFACIKISSDF